jgi:hypothetical protein
MTLSPLSLSSYKIILAFFVAFPFYVNKIPHFEIGRGDREADGAALEKRFSMFRDVGSNPTLSATLMSGKLNIKQQLSIPSPTN